MDGAIARTDLTEDEVLFRLMDAWAAQKLTQEQQSEFHGWIDRVRVN